MNFMNLKTENERRNKIVQVRLTEAEKKELQERAEKQRLNVAAYIRSELLGAK